MGKKNSRHAQKQAAVKRNRIILIVILSVVAALLIGALVFTMLQKDGGNETTDTKISYAKMSVSFTDKDGVARTGDIVIELRPDCAPLTVANFKKLVSEGFYDGTDFFRIIEGFMIQGGENASKEAEVIKGEFALNGIDNPLKHERGVISMARRGDNYDGSALTYSDGIVSYNSASSGFFIMHETTASLDGQYAAFGRVVSGMEYVDLIAETNLVYSEKYGDTVQPAEPATITRVVLMDTLD